MCFVVAVRPDAKPVYRIDMPAAGAGWKAAEVLVVCPQVFAMAGLVEGIAALEVDSPGAVPLSLAGRMARTQQLVVEN